MYSINNLIDVGNIVMLNFIQDETYW